MIFKSLAVRASIYESCRDIWEFGWLVYRSLVDGAGNGRPDRRGGRDRSGPADPEDLSANPFSYPFSFSHFFDHQHTLAK